jgi:hypothetical protein
MKRVAAVLLGVVALALLPALGCAQGLFGGLPGMPSIPFFAGSAGGPTGCGGEKVCPCNNLEGYVGYMEDRNGTSLNFDTSQIGIAGVTGVSHRFTNRGVWFGLGDTACLSNRVSFIGSAWYLVPSKSDSHEVYNSGIAERTWDTDPRWWYIDGLFALKGPSGLTLLAGLRYDYNTIRFKNPFDVSGVLDLPSDTADATSEAWIPLLGTQYAICNSAGNLVVRAVGFPTMLGNVKYNQTFGGLARTEANRGNYNNGWFLEVFAEYSRNFGPGSLGIFGRWNGFQGNSNVDVQIPPFPGNETYHLSLHRASWTIGGSVSLNFNTPCM